VLIDHKALESWAKEVLDPPSGPVGRRSRWHQIFSKFDLHVGYVPGKDNTIADILSRWAYPASQALRDVSMHGTAQDDDEMEGMIEQEKLEERGCMRVQGVVEPEQHKVLVVSTPGGTRNTSEDKGKFPERPGIGRGKPAGSVETQVQSPSRSPKGKSKARVRFNVARDGEEEPNSEHMPNTELVEPLPTPTSSGSAESTVGLASQTPSPQSPQQTLLMGSSVWQQDWDKAYREFTGGV